MIIFNSSKMPNMLFYPYLYLKIIFYEQIYWSFLYNKRVVLLLLLFNIYWKVSSENPRLKEIYVVVSVLLNRKDNTARCFACNKVYKRESNKKSTEVLMKCLNYFVHRKIKYYQQTCQAMILIVML